MNKLAPIALACCSMLLLSSCQEAKPSASSVVQVPFQETESFPFPFDEALPMGKESEGFLMSVDQMLYDYDTMWQLLEDNFPFWTAVEQEMDIDWRAYRDGFRDTLVNIYARQGHITQALFHSAITECLGKFNSVGHLYILPQSFRDTLKEYFAEDSGTFGENYLALLNQEKCEQYYELLQGIYDQYSTQNQQEEGTVPSTGTQPSVEGVVTVTGEAAPQVVMGYAEDIPYLKCGTFMDWTEETYTAVADFLRANQDADHMIIDIRGNGGGNSSTWVKGIVPYLTGETLRWDILYGGKSGALNLWLNPDYMAQAVKDDSWKEHFPNVSEEKLEGLDFVMETAALVEGKSEFDGQVWLLVDQSDYSTSDQFAVFSKDTGFATVVGSRTSGNGIGEQPYAMVLPYSGMMIYYESYVGFNEDGTCNGITGTAPDYTVKKGQTALDLCLEMIQKGFGEARKEIAP